MRVIKVQRLDRRQVATVRSKKEKKCQRLGCGPQARKACLKVRF